MIKTKSMTTLFLLLMTSVSALAQVPVAEPDRSAYLGLVEDVFDEVMSMDAVIETKSERESFSQALRLHMVSPGSSNPSAQAGKTWSGIWPPRAISKKSKAAAAVHKSSDQIRILGRVGTEEHPHALKDIPTYVNARLGRASVEMLRSKAVRVSVHGGFESSALEHLHASQDQVIRIPSFYERWGISKLFVSSRVFKDGKPRLVYIVPPSRQYLEHYATMLSSIKADIDSVVIDKVDQEQYRKRLHKSVSMITAQLGKYDYAGLGYYGQWIEVLSKPESDWNLLNVSKEVSGPLGLGGRVLTIKHKVNGRKLRLLTLKSDLTIWGESSAFIAEGVAKQSPRGIVFMGSAGTISNHAVVYGISIPKAFVTPRGRTTVANFAQYAKCEMPVASVDVTYEAVHGNTFSPIEQDKHFLMMMRSHGIDTLDVEQSLIAEVLERHNRVQPKTKTVAFAAINLVTDRPAHVLDDGHAEHDLDRVDATKKGRARLGAVTLALESLSVRETKGSCR